MSNQESTHHSSQEMVDALRIARDRARVQAHLFSLDAKQRWFELETGLLNLQSKLEQGGEKVASGASVRFREVTHALGEFLHEIDGTQGLATPVRQLMTESPVTCSRGDSLARAAQIMWDVDCGAVPVVSADGSLVGIITDRDVCMAAYTQGQPFGSLRVESAMSRHVHSCTPEQTLGHATRLMAEKQVRRLPVTDEGRLVGMLTLADLARDVRGHLGNRVPACMALVDALATVSEPRAVASKAAA